MGGDNCVNFANPVPGRVYFYRLAGSSAALGKISSGAAARRFFRSCFLEVQVWLVVGKLPHGLPFSKFATLSN